LASVVFVHLSLIYKSRAEGGWTYAYAYVVIAYVVFLPARQQMVWDECKSIQDSRGILSALKQKAAWRAFEALVASGLVYYTDQAAESKVG